MMDAASSLFVVGEGGRENTSAGRLANLVGKIPLADLKMLLLKIAVLRRCDFFGQLQPFEINPPNSAPAFALGTSCNCKQKKYLYLKPLTTNAESYSDLPEIFTTDSSN